MSINQIHLFLSVAIIIGASIVIATLIYTNFRTPPSQGLLTNNMVKEETKARKEELGAGKVDLKQEYFDDLVGTWGEGNPDTGEVKYKAFESEYFPRSKPSPIIHPLELNQDKIEIKEVRKSEIKPPFGIPEGSDKGKFTDYEAEAIKNNFSKNGNLLGSFFSDKGEGIYSVEDADVDKDGKNEKLIITSGIGGNHPPNNGYIVKNNTIIASTDFAGGAIYPSKDGNGFYIREPDYSDAPMCCPKRYLIYRVVYEDGQFVPVWEQEVYYLMFED